MNRQLRAVLWLLPVLALGAFLAWQARKVESGELKVKSSADTIFRQRGADVALSEGESEEARRAAEPVEATELFAFDPNTISYHDLMRLGFTRGEALGIVKYRERGKVFEIPEDFAACYQVSEQNYRRLEPYIEIGEKFALKKFAVRPQEKSTEVFRQRGADVALSEGESEGVYGSVNDRANDEKARQMRRDHGKLVDLNSADTTALVSVSGIGSLTAARIVEYRARLGGFYEVEQLAEIRGVTEQNFERILPQIFLDPADIQKININFAAPQKLSTHPYIEAAALRKLLKIRQLKGGWSTSEELKTDNVFTEAQLAKLLPYLSFEQ